jgi:hypothetical protein
VFLASWPCRWLCNPSGPRSSCITPTSHRRQTSVTVCSIRVTSQLNVPSPTYFQTPRRVVVCPRRDHLIFLECSLWVCEGIQACIERMEFNGSSCWFSWRYSQCRRSEKEATRKTHPPTPNGENRTTTTLAQLESSGMKCRFRKNFI